MAADEEDHTQLTRGAVTEGCGSNALTGAAILKLRWRLEKISASDSPERRVALSYILFPKGIVGGNPSRGENRRALNGEGLAVGQTNNG